MYDKLHPYLTDQVTRNISISSILSGYYFVFLFISTDIVF